MPIRPGGRTRVRVYRVDAGQALARPDSLATEEPLEIRIETTGRAFRLAVTMRTPGQDFDLAAGFLHGEGVVASAGDIRRLAYCADAELTEEERFNVVTVTLRQGLTVDLRQLERHFFTTSACGVCGKASLDQLDLRGLAPVKDGPRVTPELLTSLPATLRAAQGLFEETGGLHAAGLFDTQGRLIALREDVGRHNALDKLIGWALQEGRLPLSEHIVLVSGRASYELLQKGLAAGLPILCAVSAPSSLAVDLARRFGMTLVGFLRDGRFNVYTGLERIALAEGPT
ncbi:MAG: formate dehydrogenase accessory sulfurtransferase FdhD [Caldilineae bacterium]|nr:formate dehydrogenase accessory sulfurtransferase FdhD [Chloroflexota bacterium]MCB9176855.1 formate dehydrogenase accessory sulfurtransferase FdhD [Caldilineae bacterium]